MNKIIKCNNLGYSYSDGKHKTPVLKNLNLGVDQGESIAILGQSGCGKSTLLNLLGGIDKPDSGTIQINDINLSNLNEDKITQLRAQNLGFVYQFHHLLKDFSALDNVTMPLLIQGENKQTAKEKSEQLLIKVGLGNRTKHLPAELSGGERQRVAIARALITNPSCLLADEPTGNLDAKTAQSILTLIVDIHKEKNSSLIIVTHDEKIASKMKRVLVLENGQLK